MSKSELAKPDPKPNPNYSSMFLSQLYEKFQSCFWYGEIRIRINLLDPNEYLPVTRIRIRPLQKIVIRKLNKNLRRKSRKTLFNLEDL